MSPYYPVFLDVRDRRCVVVGGGPVSEAKVLGLLECGATVVVVAPRVTDELRELARGGGLSWVPRAYRQGDLEGAFVAIVADVDEPGRPAPPAVAKAVRAEAEARNVPLNVADLPAMCTWIAPAVVRRGDVAVAVSTGGASPALARRFREELSGVSRLKSKGGIMELAALAPLLSEARGELARRGVRLDADHWQACLTDDIVGLLRDGGSGEAAATLMARLVTGADCYCPTGKCKLWEGLPQSDDAAADGVSSG